MQLSLVNTAELLDGKRILLNQLLLLLDELAKFVRMLPILLSNLRWVHARKDIVRIAFGFVTYVFLFLFLFFCLGLVKAE